MFFAALPTPSPQTQAEMTIEQVAGALAASLTLRASLLSKRSNEPSGLPW